MSTEEKQNFLREKILDEGYDTNQFVQFLTEKKGEQGADVANWSMEDLKSVVNEFIKLNGGQVEEEVKKPEPKKISMFDVLVKSSIQKTQSQSTQKQQNKPQPIQNQQNKPQPVQNQQNKPQPIQNQQNKSQPIQNQQNKPQPTTEIKKSQISKNEINHQAPPQNPQKNVANVNNNITGTESDYGIITPEKKDCKIIEQTDLSKYDKLEITVSQPEKKKEGFLSKTYVTYQVHTMPASYIVRRRYTDFIWLRNILVNYFPTSVIPPIPKKTKLVGDNYATPINLKRGRGLEKFMNYLAEDPIIKNSQLFFDFLKTDSEANFNNKKKFYEKLKPINDVSEFKNNDSKVDIMISTEKENYLENIRDNSTVNINLFKKLNISFKTLFDEINIVTSRMDEIACIWEQIYKSSVKYFDNNTTCEIYNQMTNLFSNWSKILKQQNVVVNVDIREHFKFIRKDFVSMRDLANSIDIHKNNYSKASRNLIAKKDDLFKRGDPTRWELDPHDKIEMTKIANNKKAAILLMCKKETQNVIGLKEFYGFNLNRVISEYERMRNLNSVVNKDVLYNNLKKLTDINGEFLIFTGEITSAVDSKVNDCSNDNQLKLKRIPMEA